MRFHDLKEGELYVLRRDRAVQVTVLPTSAELRARARVMVRFEVGVARGRETDIPTRAIAAPVDRALAPSRPAARRAKTPDVPVLHRPARVNDQVTLAETGE